MKSISNPRSRQYCRHVEPTCCLSQNGDGSLSTDNDKITRKKTLGQANGPSACVIIYFAPGPFNPGSPSTLSVPELNFQLLDVPKRHQKSQRFFESPKNYQNGTINRPCDAQGSTLCPKPSSASRRCGERAKQKVSS